MLNTASLKMNNMSFHIFNGKLYTTQKLCKYLKKNMVNGNEMTFLLL